MQCEQEHLLSRIADLVWDLTVWSFWLGIAGLVVKVLLALTN
jgi:hypothetical protein